MKITRQLGLFVFLAGTFVTALVVGDILGGKLTEVTLFNKAFVVSVGMIPFPVTFLLTDLLNEFYGKRAARFITLAGFVMALFAYATIFVAMTLPWAPFTRDPSWEGMRDSSFDNVFNGSKRILVGSMVAYLIAQFLDIGTFHLLKQKTKGRFLWLRATGSTVVSQLVDTFVITFIAWGGLRTFGEMTEMAATSYVIKLVVAIGLTPGIYAGHAVVERLLRIQPMKLDEDGDVQESEQGSP